MTSHKWGVFDGVRWRCTVCAEIADAQHDGQCSGVSVFHPTLPPLYKRLTNFTVAAIGHALAGLPTCTQEQIDQRLSVCHACQLFNPSNSDPDKGVCTHEKCGCNAGREAKFLNKLAWADQQCPLGKWPSVPAHA